MKNLRLRSDLNTIGDFQNESIQENKWRGIQQISYFFSYFFTFLSVLIVEQNFILIDFSLQKSIFVKEQSLSYCNRKT